jgi:hypothetical protein
MPEFAFVKVREGGLVRRFDQSMRPIRPEGEFVPRIDFYNRLILTGDLVECDPPAPDEPAAVAAADEPASADAPAPDKTKRR